MKTIFYLLRHAESAPDRNLPEADWPLSERGEAQAVALIPVLQSLNVTNIISSPYLRSYRTAAPFAREMSLEITLEPDLRERKLAEGLIADWETLIRRAWDDLSFCASGGESGLVCQQRVAACIHRWVAKIDDEDESSPTMLFCSHGNAIGLFLNLLDPEFGYEGWRAMRNPDLFSLAFQDGRVTWDREFTF